MIIYLWKKRKKNVFLSKNWLLSFAKRIYEFPSLLRIVGLQWLYRKRGVTIGSFSVIETLEFVGNGKCLTIGDNTFIGKNVKLRAIGGIKIGNNVVINERSVFLSGSHDINDPKWPLIKKPIIVDDFAWIAVNVTILPGITIGRGAVVGAGSVVVKNVAPNDVVAGNPAKKISTRLITSYSYSPVENVACCAAWLK